jgi:formate/nitrite transporter
MSNLLSPEEIADKMIDIGIKKVKRSSLQMFLLGGMAGAFIALGAYASNMVIHAMAVENYGVLKFVQGAVFPVGLILVLVAGADLFTGNTLIFMSLVDQKVTWREKLKNWGLVYLGNFIGSVLFAWLIHQSGLFATSGGRLGALHVEIAAGKTTLPFMQAVVRGILANFVVCLAVWMGVGSKDMIGKVVASWFPIMAFVAGGFEHSIANMYYIPAGIFAQGNFASVANVSSQGLASLSWGGFLQNLIPVTIGNIIGGALLVGGVYWVIFKQQGKKQLAS